jgi:hypothetical protein
MPKITLQGGMHLEVPNRDENREDIARVMDERELIQARGVKWMRLPEMYGTPANSALTMDESHGTVVGPEQGYVWSLRRIVVDGLTASATTPDILNMYRNSTGSAPLWQFNGNSFGYTFGRLEMTLMGGDTLMFASVGTFAATGRVRVSGELVEVPAEMAWKLV